MKRFYQTPQTTALKVRSESAFMSTSVEPVQEVRLAVEVDDYVTIDAMNISFD